MATTIPKLNDNQLNRLSEFTANLALVFFASLVVPIFSGIESLEVFSVLLGVILGVISLVISLVLIKR